MIPVFSRDVKYAGEPNIQSAGLDGETGDFRVAIANGKFATPEAQTFHEDSLQVVLKEIAFDGLILGRDQKLVVERPFDNPGFADAAVAKLRTELKAMNHPLADRIVLENASAATVANHNQRALDYQLEAKRFAAGKSIKQLTTQETATLPIEIRTNPDLQNDVRVIDLAPGDALLKSDSYGDHVYIVVEGELSGQPVGGYGQFEVKSGAHVGEAAILNYGKRSADVFAKGRAKVVMIPASSYRQHLFKPVTANEAAKVLLQRVEQPR